MRQELALTAWMQDAQQVRAVVPIHRLAHLAALVDSSDCRIVGLAFINPLSQHHVIFCLLPISQLRQKPDSDCLHPGRACKFCMPANARCPTVKTIRERTVKRGTVSTIEDEAQIVIAKARGDISAIGIIYAEIEHIKLLPGFALSASI